MSDWLVRLQETLSNYPQWLVVGGFIVVVGVGCILLGKIMRVLGFALAVLGIVAAGWYGWQRMTRPPEPAPAPGLKPHYSTPTEHPPVYQPAEPAPARPN